jgi:ATP-binding cassette subfamily B (MDR/TAP) protein 1
MTLVFGQFTADFNDFAIGTISPDAFRNRVDSFVLYFVYLFIGKFVLAYSANV